jgi:hypothetical protein
VSETTHEQRRAFRRDRSLRPALANNVVLESGRIADDALSAAKGENTVGRPEGQYAQSERPDVSAARLNITSRCE